MHINLCLSHVFIVLKHKLIIHAYCYSYFKEKVQSDHFLAVFTVHSVCVFKAGIGVFACFPYVYQHGIVALLASLLLDHSSASALLYDGAYKYMFACKSAKLLR